MQRLGVGGMAVGIRVSPDRTHFGPEAAGALRFAVSDRGVLGKRQGCPAASIMRQ
jgi:hypothetical protein